MIKVSNLVHSYLKYGKTEEDTISVKALDHVDMEIDKGEFIAIIGHNGSGKSTLAKHFNGLLFPAEGTVWINELPTSDHKNLGQIRRTVCMVFQNPDNQIIGATVEEDISFGLENMQIPREQMQDRIDRSLEAVRMTDKRQANPGSLSGGQKQKTAIAGAVAVSPECLVLDEATASCIYTQKRNKKIRKPQAANQTALIFDRRAAARLLSINSIRRLCWS